MQHKRPEIILADSTSNTLIADRAVLKTGNISTVTVQSTDTLNI
jgi:hypothetical protein